MAEALVPATTQKRPGRVLGFSYAGVALAIFVVVIPALKPPQPPPPPTAEYAPPVSQLKAPPPEQTSQAGRGAEGTGGGAGGSPPTPPPASPSPAAPGTQGGQNTTFIDTPKIKHCVGDPPRQIEDTQSPPCISYFAGDNGGATYSGVTRDEIQVAFIDESYQFVEDMVNFFNDRFQFYGRKIRLTRVAGGCAADPAGMQGLARYVAKRRFFASLQCNDKGGIESYYYDELARSKPPILSVSDREVVATDAHFGTFAPYEWNYFPAMDRLQDHYAELACQQLQGKPASYTLPDLLFPPQRKFGVVVTSYTNAPPIDTTELFNKLEACNIKIPAADRRQVDFNDQVADQGVLQQASAAAVQLNNDHVTTVICVCHITTATTMMQASTGQHYSPEWIVSTFGTTDYEPLGKRQPEQQWDHTIGVSAWNKWLPIASMPCYAAERAGNPGFNFQQSALSEIGCSIDYEQLLLLASGIQMAGPILTPETFAAGLARTRFPNPPSPTFEGGVGFEGGSHTMVKDVALVWYDSNTPGPYAYATATWCYVNRGARVRLGGYGAITPDFQKQPCDP